MVLSVQLCTARYPHAMNELCFKKKEGKIVPPNTVRVEEMVGQQLIV